MTKALTTHEDLRSKLTQASWKGQLANALPKHMTADRLVRVALTAAVKNDRLLECTPESIYKALLDAAQLGLEPNSRDAHLVPYRDNRAGVTNCQLVPDYKGLVQLAFRSGQVASFRAMAVREKDTFDYAFGSKEFLKHIPYTGAEDPGPLVAAWAQCRLKGDDSAPFVVLTKRQVEQRRASSKTANNGPWKTHPDSMWAKSAAKELCKWIPQTAEMQDLQKAIMLDDEFERGGVIEARFEEPRAKTTVELLDPSKTAYNAMIDALATCETEDATNDVIEQIDASTTLSDDQKAELTAMADQHIQRIRGE